MPSARYRVSMNSEIDLFCKSLYAEVQQYWESKRDFLPRTWELKFGIFYSPVRYRPALMIIGANPGFDSDDDTKAPPARNLFYDPKGRNPDEWRIVPILKRLFLLVDYEEMLRHSVVTNLLFFKSRCLGTHATTGQGWCDNGNPKVRREIEDYCRNRVEEIVRTLNPIRILVLGLATWDKLASKVNRTIRRTSTGGRLAARGTVFDMSALGIIHPTGAWMGDDDCRQLAPFFVEFLASQQ